MKYLAVVLSLTGISTGAFAQGAIPDLKGTWTAKGRSVVYGSNQHHPGAQSGETPRIQEIEFNFVVTGQDGNNLWGYNYSNVANIHEPFAWSLAKNGRTGIGADTDGYYQISVESADSMEVCYAHNRLSPSGSIVTSCQTYKRAKR
jgi:hypothetical protein